MEEQYDAPKPARTTYTVQAFVELPDLEAAQELAQRWVIEAGGMASVYRRHTWPRRHFVRVEQYGVPK